MAMPYIPPELLGFGAIAFGLVGVFLWPKDISYVLLGLSLVWTFSWLLTSAIAVGS